MRTVVLVSVLALVAAHRENRMIQEVEQRRLVSCVVTVVQRHFAVGKTIQLLSTGDDNQAKSVLEAIHRLELWPLQVTGPKRAPVSPPNIEKISSYIIFTRSVKDFAVQAEMLYDSTSWDSHGLFLIVGTFRVPEGEELALSIIRELWYIGRGYNVVLVVQQDDLLNLYTWFPYSSHDNCADVKNVVLINQWVMEDEGKFVTEGSIYPSKIPSNFHGCAMNLSAFMKSGFEDEFYSQYFLTHNIARNYVNGLPDFFPSFEKLVIGVQSLQDRESDMLFGGLALLGEEIINAEHSFPLFPVRGSWFVPCPKPLSRLQKISHIFTPSVWVVIVVVLFLVTVTFWCLAKQSNDIRSYTTISSALYNVWAVTVGVPVAGMPRSFRFRFLFLVFVLYCFAMSTVFQTFLTSFLVDPGYDNQLTSLDEILDSGIEFGYHKYAQTFFILSSDLRHEEVVERGKVCSTSEACIGRIRETGNFATFAAVWEVWNYTNVINDHSTICLLNDDDYNFFFVTAYMQNGSVFLESLNKFVFLYTESGMFHRMLRDTIYMSISTRNTIDVSDGYFVFTLNHLRIAFYILFFGHGLSFLLFLCEVFYHFRLRYV